MTLMNGISSTNALMGFVVLVAVLGILYVFYPALSISETHSKVMEKVVSTTKHGDGGKVLLSFVIPAYNEEERLPVMLDATLASIAKHRKKIVELAQAKVKTTKSTAFEWVVVSDGSTDGTSEVVEKYGRASKGDDVWKVVTLHTNSGKGAAVRTGMLAAQGALRLMVDADGATEFDALLKVLEQDAPIVFGSRAHLASQSQRTFVRTMLMYAFHFCVDLLVGSNIRDTQCGFKLFTADVAVVLFGNLHLQRWAFDIELVVLASQLSLDIAEVGVSWEEVEGSKLDSSKFQLALVAVGMLRDMLCVRLCYTFGIW
eukprot:CAMPEP_0119005030 /NCGR_PEP_ID=MMETSP1176-20130426/1489_1 /TAXON_ID=265551 /ORGANISM="Synedropsis recta cf, Strain CCMP1620" /LENGTH=314 /DNA_ID=CAMNT_0006956795 /DNA_START=12 /DNA_END=953 /DNA_ORIENTATION=+